LLRIHDTDGMHKVSGRHSWGERKLVELSALKDVAAGWLAKDALVLQVDITVKREDRFQVDTGAPIKGFVCQECHAHLCVCRRWRALRRDPEAAVRGGGSCEQPPPSGGLDELLALFARL
jgi:hypothetical protein